VIGSSGISGISGSSGSSGSSGRSGIIRKFERRWIERRNNELIRILREP